MTGHEIRQKYLEFFKSKEHTIVTSDSLVPKDDPTVLFTTAGMQQFKAQFMGHIEGYTKATSSQKCMRTDDLDEVGVTDFHHTFFEMLGNFSFGDYFKKEAIHWGWEFLTKELGIEEDKLWVSVHKDDDEAAQIWLNEIKLPEERLVRLGDKSNFWPANAPTDGPNGPCGPCSEIFFDWGVGPNGEGEGSDPDNDPTGRFCEVWNLVFTEYNRMDGGKLEPLPSQNIDTGMGLERLTAVMQGKHNNFETDIFAPILTAIEKLLKDQKADTDLKSKRIMADHMRAIVIAISDGVIPSNEGRGYVIRKLIVDVTDLMIRSGVNKALVHTLADSVADSLKPAFPELVEKLNNIKTVVKNVEEAYFKVRLTRVPEFIERLKTLDLNSADSVTTLGDLYFTYRDRYGLTLSTISDIAQESGINEDIHNKAIVIFEAKMHEQKERSRAGSKMTGDVFTEIADANLPKTEFLGYESSQATAKILKIYREGQEVSSCQDSDQVRIVLDQTPFYAESGGQVGDAGYFTNGDAQIRISDTQKVNDVFFHSAQVINGVFQEGDEITAKIDSERRAAIMRNHSATHLLQSALRTVLGDHIKQQGSLCDENRLRFDFSHPKAVTQDEINRIEEIVNGFVQSCDEVNKQVMTLEEAQQQGALAFFAEKYGETVRIVSMGDYSKEFCGGTHLNFTGEIGLFKVSSEGAVAQGIRRIEAITGTRAIENVKENELQLKALADQLKAPSTEVVNRVKLMTKKVKDLEKEISRLKLATLTASVDEIVKSAEDINGYKVVINVFDGVDMGSLKQLSDVFKQKAQSAIIILGATQGDSASIIAAVTDDLVKKNIKANELIKDIAPLIGGKGGGRPNMAQAGSKEPSKVAQALEQSKAIIKDSIS